MKIKKDDTVIVITGKDKGKTGKVTRAFPKKDMVIIAGVNVRKVHKKSKKAGQKGQVAEKTFPIHVSNVMIVDPKTNKQTRVGKKKVGLRWIRVTKKSQTEIDK